MISKEEVKHIAKLARLELTEEEIKKMQKDLTEILNYVDVLKTAGVKQRPALTKSQRRALPDSSNLRKDEAKPSNLASEIVTATPDKKDGFFKVKPIL